VSNIAEGKGRCSDKDTLRFFATARGSLFEIETQIALAEQLSYIDGAHAREIASRTSEVGRLINGLMRALDSESSNSAFVA
jgi:four helix bundle protein